MGNSKSIPLQIDPSYEFSDDIDVSKLPKNPLKTKDKIQDESFSDHGSNQQSSDLAIFNLCLKHLNPETNIPGYIEMEKEVINMRIKTNDAIWRGIMNQNLEASELPFDCDDLDY